MEYIIGAIALLLGLFLAGYFLKKRYFKDVDRLEAWKIDIMNRPVLEEMSKVKQLNMTGQTEELFDRWRQEWDEIVTVQAPDVEELLFDAEDYIDKYRFNKGKEVLAAIEEKLNEIEDNIKNILNELNELVGSEEKNRIEIAELKELYRESKKNLLAHRLNFGTAENTLEAQLDLVMEKFKAFESHTENGNYLEAREVVLTIQAELDSIAYKMNVIPELLYECHTGIPNQLSILKDGYKQMIGQNYVLSHIELEIETERIEDSLAAYLVQLENTEVDDVKLGIEEVKESIDNLLDLLEKEAHAMQYVKKHKDGVEELLESAAEESRQLKEETKFVQQSYHLSQKELTGLEQAEKRLDELLRQYDVLAAKISENDTAQSVLEAEVAMIKDELDAVLIEQKNFKEKLNALRKEEIAAREKIHELTRKVSDLGRLVSKNNIPGLSQEYRYLMSDARESMQSVVNELEQKPLDISAIQQHLEIAVMTVDKLTRSTTDIIENVMLAEKVIQYGNRYRSRYPSVAKGLSQAEDAFRSYDYREALEQAATSIEEVEPGALKKIETMLSEQQ
ncbi:septation ring formation regulator EzrA [Mesobacillus harenae]|uniref:septation ring formation regulator EzrA n=1 Tax=Mesobacillus harenae TaxID=2213203 RepID=UPI001580A59E|nr:septation ring formation regulator EzrA [Mesobacillus harenae]